MVAQSKLTVTEIAEINRKHSEAWSSPHGWAPDEAANLLASSRLDWQVSLSETLGFWTGKANTGLSDGELILAWVNLGALVEGTLKLLFSIYYLDYLRDADKSRDRSVYDQKKGRPRDPDGLPYNALKMFAVRKTLFKEDIIEFLNLVQERRNAIHAFKGRKIGDADEFVDAVDDYLRFLREVSCRLPDPPPAPPRVDDY